MSIVTIKELLETGAHFGHNTKVLNPKMSQYIHSERNDIHIIDLLQTEAKINEAYQAVSNVTAEGGNVLFVGTKDQAKEAIEEEAKRCGSQYIKEAIEEEAKRCGSQYINEGYTENTLMNMERLPDIIFIVDPGKEHAIINEACKLHIPIIAMVDTNGDPDNIDYVIPINDDAVRTIKLTAGLIANAIISARDDN